MNFFGRDVESLSEKFKVNTLMVFNAVLMITAMVIWQIKPVDKIQASEQQAAQMATKASAQADAASKAAVTASQSAKDIADLKTQVNKLFPGSDQSAFCPAVSADVTRLVGGILDRWVKLPGERPGWEYKKQSGGEAVTLIAPVFGELINTLDGAAIKPGSSLKIVTGNYHTYYWCS